MQYLHILCGIPASGKSTWAKQQLAKATEASIIISRDKIRFSMIRDGDDYFEKENEVFKEFVEEIKQAIENQYVHIYVDATNINRRSRSKLVKAIGSMKRPYICIIFETFFVSLDKAFSRNSKRSGREKVPNEAIDSMYRSFVLPNYIEGRDYVDLYHYWAYDIHELRFT